MVVVPLMTNENSSIVSTGEPNGVGAVNVIFGAK
jgi:hypothetical protein